MVKYSPEFDELNDEEQYLLAQCVKSVEDFVQNSKKINETDYATRDAHAKTYAVLRGNLYLEENLPQIVSEVFSEKSYEVLVRLSHANPVITRSKKENPAFGFALKIKNIQQKDANFPLANFPLFPMKSVSGFLKFFTSLNTFLVTKADNFVVSVMDLPSLLKNTAGFIPNFLSFDFVKNFAKILKRKTDFILSFDFHSSGVYRIGDYMMKISAVPHSPNPIFGITLDQRTRTENFFKLHDARFDLMIQLCENTEQQPINDLTKMWKNAPFLKTGTLHFEQNCLLNPEEIEVENLSFNPFENPETLLPVGKLQQIRKEIYKTSIDARTRLNENQIL